MSAVTDVVVPPGLDCEWIVMPSDKSIVDRSLLVNDQEDHADSRPIGLIVGFGQPPLWQKEQGRLWVPADSKLL